MKRSIKMALKVLIGLNLLAAFATELSADQHEEVQIPSMFGKQIRGGTTIKTPPSK